MVSNKAAAISSIFTKVAGKFYENKHLTLKDLDNAKLQYEEFINHVASRYQEELVNWWHKIVKPKFTEVLISTKRS